MPYDITEASVTQKLVDEAITVIAISTVGEGGSTTGPGLNADPAENAFQYEPYCDVINGSPGQATRIAEATDGQFFDGVVRVSCWRRSSWRSTRSCSR